MRKRRSAALLGAAGICAVGRFYTDASGNQQLLVADEVNGAWDNAIRLPDPSGPGLAAEALVSVKPRTSGIPGPGC
jgi:hypothetical protein